LDDPKIVLGTGCPNDFIRKTGNQEQSSGSLLKKFLRSWGSYFDHLHRATGSEEDPRREVI
jgi:hypothetical protein